MAQATTHDIVVRVWPTYLDDHSRPEVGRWIWAYTVEIENRGDQTLQLITRRWIITDGRGRVEEVQGDGVVGDQPTLEPGQLFRYTSSCPLPTSSGTMKGSYHMVTPAGVGFDIEIPEFSLDLPDAARRLN